MKSAIAKLATLLSGLGVSTAVFASTCCVEGAICCLGGLLPCCW
jgi:hypothetical protein